MKYRQGFVSNSSSSSFIVKFDRRKFSKCPTCGVTLRNPIELVNLDNFGAYENRVEWRNVQDCIDTLDAQMKDATEEGWSDWVQELNDLKAKLSKANDECGEHDTICGIQLDNHGDAMTRFRELVDQDLVEVLNSEY
jgi:hypothetical protein